MVGAAGAAASHPEVAVVTGILPDAWLEARLRRASSPKVRRNLSRKDPRMDITLTCEDCVYMSNDDLFACNRGDALMAGVRRAFCRRARWC
jgi:hypothetical protein